MWPPHQAPECALGTFSQIYFNIFFFISVRFFPPKYFQRCAHFFLIDLEKRTGGGRQKWGKLWRRHSRTEHWVTMKRLLSSIFYARLSWCPGPLHIVGRHRHRYRQVGHTRAIAWLPLWMDCYVFWPTPHRSLCVTRLPFAVFCCRMAYKRSFWGFSFDLSSLFWSFGFVLILLLPPHKIAIHLRGPDIQKKIKNENNLPPRSVLCDVGSCSRCSAPVFSFQFWTRLNIVCTCTSPGPYFLLFFLFVLFLVVIILSAN